MILDLTENKNPNDNTVHVTQGTDFTLALHDEPGFEWHIMNLPIGMSLVKQTGASFVFDVHGAVEDSLDLMQTDADGNDQRSMQVNVVGV